jgi:RimJ/RimL family protein N-acetyltransferase
MNLDIQLSDSLILLRPPQLDDAFAIHQAVLESLAELHPWMDWATERYDAASTRRWLEHVLVAWEHSSSFHFVITSVSTGEFIGSCSVDGINEKERSCNLGYWVRTSRTGQGIASRVIRLAAKFAFESVKLSRAEIVVAVENLASQRAAEKAGAHFVCTLTGRVVIRSDVHDGVMFLLTPTDFSHSG